MKPVEIDLSGNWGRATRRIIGMAGLLLMVSIVWLSYSAIRLYRLKAEVNIGQDRMQALDQRNIPNSRVTPLEGEKLAIDLEKASRILDVLNTPWGELLTAIEATYVEQVIVISIDPDMERRELRLGAEAANAQAMLDYLAALRTQKVFHGALLLSHQVNPQDAQRPIRFVIIAPWRNPMAQPHGAGSTLTGNPQ